MSDVVVTVTNEPPVTTRISASSFTYDAGSGNGYSLQWQVDDYYSGISDTGTWVAQEYIASQWDDIPGEFGFWSDGEEVSFTVSDAADPGCEYPNCFHDYRIVVEDTAEPVNEDIADTIKVYVNNYKPLFVYNPPDFLNAEFSLGMPDPLPVTWKVEDEYDIQGTYQVYYKLGIGGTYYTLSGSDASGNWDHGVGFTVDINKPDITTDGTWYFKCEAYDDSNPAHNPAALDEIEVEVGIPATVSQITPPSQQDITYSAGQTGNIITWALEDSNPDYFTIERDGVNVGPLWLDNGNELSKWSQVNGDSVIEAWAGDYLYDMVEYDDGGVPVYTPFDRTTNTLWWLTEYWPMTSTGKSAGFYRPLRVSEGIADWYIDMEIDMNNYASGTSSAVTGIYIYLLNENKEPMTNHVLVDGCGSSNCHQLRLYDYYYESDGTRLTINDLGYGTAYDVQGSIRIKYVNGRLWIYRPPTNSGSYPGQDTWFDLTSLASEADVLQRGDVKYLMIRLYHRWRNPVSNYIKSVAVTGQTTVMHEDDFLDISDWWTTDYDYVFETGPAGSISPKGWGAKVDWWYPFRGYEVRANTNHELGLDKRNIGTILEFPLDDGTGGGGTVTDLSGNGNTGTLYGTTWYSGYLNFGGATLNEQIEVVGDESLSTPEGTISLFFRLNALPSAYGYMDLGGCYYSPYSDHLLLRLEDDYVYVALEVGNVHKIALTSETVNWVTGSWYNLVVTQDGEGAKIYLNGTELSTTGTNSGEYWTDSWPYVNWWRFGAMSWTYDLYGDMKNIRMLDRAISSEEVDGLWNDGYDIVGSDPDEFTIKMGVGFNNRYNNPFPQDYSFIGEFNVDIVGSGVTLLKIRYYDTSSCYGCHNLRLKLSYFKPSIYGWATLFSTGSVNSGSIFGNIIIKQVKGHVYAWLPGGSIDPIPYTDTWLDLTSMAGGGEIFASTPQTVRFNFERTLYRANTAHIYYVDVSSGNTDEESKYPWYDQQQVSINVDGHTSGSYVYRATAYNQGGYSSYDEVIVTVDNPPPEFQSQSSDIVVDPYHEMGGSGTVSWLFNDNDPSSYIIKRDSTTIYSGSWTGGPISLDLSDYIHLYGNDYPSSTEFDLWCFATDTEANVAVNPTPLIVRISNWAPRVLSIPDDAQTDLETDVLLEWDAEDGNPDTWSIWDDYMGQKTMWGSPGWPSWSGGSVDYPFVPSVRGPGLHKITAQFKDTNGLITESAISEIEVRDFLALWQFASDYTFQWSDDPPNGFQETVWMPTKLQVYGIDPTEFDDVQIRVWVDNPDSANGVWDTDELSWPQSGTMDTFDIDGYYVMDTKTWGQAEPYLGTSSCSSCPFVGTMYAYAYNPASGEEATITKVFELEQETSVVHGYYTTSSKKNYGSWEFSEPQTVTFRGYILDDEAGNPAASHGGELRCYINRDDTGWSYVGKANVDGNGMAEVTKKYKGEALDPGNYYVRWRTYTDDYYADTWQIEEDDDYFVVDGTEWEYFDGFEDGTTNQWELGGVDVGFVSSFFAADNEASRYQGTYYGQQHATNFWEVGTRRDMWTDTGAPGAWNNAPYTSFNGETVYISGAFRTDMSNRAMFYFICEDWYCNDNYVRLRAQNNYLYFEKKIDGAETVMYTSGFPSGVQPGYWWKFEVKFWSGTDNVMKGRLAWDGRGLGPWSSSTKDIMVSSDPSFTGSIKLYGTCGLGHGDVYWDSIRFANTPAWYPLSLEDYDDDTERKYGIDNIPVANVVKNDDYYLFKDVIVYEDLESIELNSSIIKFDNTTEIELNPDLLMEKLGSDSWTAVNIGKIPNNVSLGTVFINNTYNVLVNGAWTTISISHDYLVVNQTQLESEGIFNVYDNLQKLYSILESFNGELYTKEERMVLLNWVSYLLDLTRKNRFNEVNEKIDIIQDISDIEEIISDYLTPEEINNSNDGTRYKIALVLGIEHYPFSTLSSVSAVTNDYLEQVKNLENQGYHVFYLSNEMLTEKNLNWTINTIANYENINSTLYVSYTGHATRGGINRLVNETQSIILTTGEIISDQRLQEMFSIWESERQFFIINTCYGEGIAYDLQQYGRIIISSTAIDEIDRIGLFAEYTPFNEIFLEYWDYSLSIEDNYLVILSELKTTVILFDFDEEEDLYI